MRLFTMAWSAVVAVASGGFAFGGVVHRDLPDVNLYQNSFSLDLNEDAEPDVNFGLVTYERRREMPPFDVVGYFSILFAGTAEDGDIVGVGEWVDYEEPVADVLSYGQLIGPESRYTRIPTDHDGGVAVAGTNEIIGGGGKFGTGYMGLKFDINGAIHYGWAHIREGYFLTDCAYETRANTPILAGAVPEPALISLVAPVLLLLRRRSRA